MKKLIVLLAAGALAVSATADLTQFQWHGGKALDENGNALPSGTEIYTTTIDLSSSIFHMGGAWGILPSDIPWSFHSVDAISVAPPFLGGAYSTLPIAGSNTIEGQYLPVVYAVLKNGTGPLQIGDWIGLSAGFQTVDLNPMGLPEQEFYTGDIQTNILIIPEPATAGLMGIVSCGFLFVRRIFTI